MNPPEWKPFPTVGSEDFWPKSGDWTYGIPVSKRELIAEKRESILQAARQHGATSIRLFGSVARGDETGGSDIDFLVRMEPGRSLLDMGGLQFDLEELLGCNVDLVSERGLRPRFRDRVLREALAV